MDTTDPIVPPQPESQAAPARGRRHSRWFVAWAVCASTLALLTISSFFVSVPYATIEPGSARAVNKLVDVTGHSVYPPRGEVLFTTVGVRDNVSVMQAFVGWLDPHVDVISEKALRGDAPPEEYERRNVEAMADSKTTAEEIVLRHLGFTDLGGGASIHDVQPDVPAASVLKANDLVIGVDGKPVSTAADAAAAIRSHQPGDPITLTIVRDGGAPTEVSTSLVEGDQGQALLGVRMTTEIKLPFGIEIDSGNVEGPSAGLAYALALLDELTPGELTGGRRVAVTGELAPDGRVGPVGGVTQKAEAVKRAGVKLFLVPKDNFAEASKQAGDGLQIRPVETFDDALRVLGSFDGSNALALSHPDPPPDS